MGIIKRIAKEGKVIEGFVVSYKAKNLEKEFAKIIMETNKKNLLLRFYKSKNLIKGMDCCSYIHYKLFVMRCKE